ncbi:MAG: hypothetical protein EZS26_002671 [Candidatus Ordinivivax streblomastigis]|uniref:Uncharacterized protein n=1 Tax=Candidatus Ordinivivax streblomastigis TaxID=2540710 RepID=A0A5M8NWV0_9BACT|nr:MAG: hypothetical protein EZS26_002671 [Candidatus Ordinivivax streblomastigis]
MKKASYLIVLILSLFPGHALVSQTTVQERVVTLRSQLTVEEKIDILCAKAPSVPRLNIPSYD